jgi:hypothetical protein
VKAMPARRQAVCARDDHATGVMEAADEVLHSREGIAVTLQVDALGQREAEMRALERSREPSRGEGVSLLARGRPRGACALGRADRLAIIASTSGATG